MSAPPSARKHQLADGAETAVAGASYVVAFSGHMVDVPDRPEPRFPSECVGAAREWLGHALHTLSPLSMHASAARGGNLLVLELARAEGASTQLTLPHGRQRFVAESVDMPGARDASANWRTRFECELSEAAHLVELCPGARAPLALDYELTNRVLLGGAALAADERGAPLALLALWDGRAGDGPGGTAAMLALASTHEIDAMVLDVDALRTRRESRWPLELGRIRGRLPEPGVSVERDELHAIAHVVVGLDESHAEMPDVQARWIRSAPRTTTPPPCVQAYCTDDAAVAVATSQRLRSAGCAVVAVHTLVADTRHDVFVRGADWPPEIGHDALARRGVEPWASGAYAALARLALGPRAMQRAPGCRAFRLGL